MQMDAVTALGQLDLGTIRREPSEMGRELASLGDAVCDPPVVLGIASAEYHTDEVWEFLSNALLLWWPSSGGTRRLCAFDDGLKIEGVAFAPSSAHPCEGTLALLYDNDSKAPGGYKLVHDVRLPHE